MSKIIREVVECDECGFNEIVDSEAHAIVFGWRFTSTGTKCVMCAGECA